MRRVLSLLTLALLALVVAAPPAGAAPIPPTQDPNQAPAFIGAPADAQPLPKPPKFDPTVSGLHGDGGNTKTFATSGPLGSNPSLDSAVGPPLGPFMWDAEGRLTAGCVLPNQVNTTGQPLRCIAALDATSLNVLSRWTSPLGQDLNLPYTNGTSDGRVIVSSRQGHVYVLRRSDATSPPSFSLLRDIDLVGLGVLDGQRPLLAASFDASGNVWFTTGGILGIGDQPGTSTTLGYVDPAGAAHSLELPNQIVENGVAVNGSHVFVVTGPAGDADVANASGHMYALRAGAGGVEIVWQQSYDAGSSRKPGGFARGSGATPTLLGGRYVAMTDNADSQIKVLVFRQDASERQLVCSVPVFSPGASANDIGLVGWQDGPTNSLVVLDDYNAIPIVRTTENTSVHDMNPMAPGMARVDIGPGGKSCATSWTTEIRIKSVPVLSAQTGLLYGYAQDPTLAAQGQFVWYFTAIDVRTGAIVWQARAGAGGTYDDAYMGASLGPDGTLYQGLIAGTVMLRG